MKKWILIILLVLFVYTVYFFTIFFLDHKLLICINVFFSLVAFIIAMLIIFENRSPSKTINWLIVLILFPVLGFFSYALFGRSYHKRKIGDKNFYIQNNNGSNIELKTLMKSKKELTHERQRVFSNLAFNLGDSPLSFHTEVKVLTNGEVTFDEIIKSLQKAEHHIHLEYYIIRDDVIGRKIKNILIKKAREGVKIRCIYDTLGSWKLSKQYLSDLRSVGVSIKPFLPLKIRFLNNHINYRNHKKIIVVDGKIGFTGGINIGDEYLGKDKKVGFWRDTHLMLKGEAVNALQYFFIKDWLFAANEKFNTEEYFIQDYKSKHQNLGAVQVINSGPDQKWVVMKNLFFSMIISAKKSIWFASPYFIPDEDILSALKVACLNGIDVKFIFPSNPDNRFVYYASRSYFLDLIEAGMKIYQYNHGFMHSKFIIIDQDYATIGTTNMDMRSFHLNFEVNVFLYQQNSVKKLVEDFENDLLDSTFIGLEQFKNRSRLQKIAESFARLASPLL
ncbi:cardiolipin synthase [Chengkuizengella axinellae]|uniref:Cardiolipin synthase n=1 Tax=Chengkuizengella axinellae TaxID=3064388 RepID=A0ABT9J1V4_9BACL|nr:cardiolipin synthase [Chengkuizengella sp. 2205SS18-9]MDP5275588.1 cardiolipin synthase [Chengkuizengella sp. 2205SS18-9]